MLGIYHPGNAQVSGSLHSRYDPLICLFLTTLRIITFGHYSVVLWIDQTMTQVNQALMKLSSRLYS
jgi:hypothetical protein